MRLLVLWTLLTIISAGIVWCLSAPAASGHHDTATPPLSGGFIQFTCDALKELSGDDWHLVLRDMKALRMNTVILQYLAMAKNAGKDPPLFLFEELGTADPTPIILEQANKLNLNVYLGLLCPPGDSNAQPGFWKPDNLATFAAANRSFAKQIGEKYRGFKGWYVPLENWLGKYPQPGSEEFPESWRKFYADVTAACKSVRPLPVAISPCLPDPGYSNPNAEEAATVYEAMLRKTNLDIVMLQDSVGAKPKTWSPEGAAAYLPPLKKVCSACGIQLWSNVESFETVGSNRVPCSFSRFDQQLSATSGVERRVTFDFFHYMNGKVRLKSWSPEYLRKIQELHDQYRDKFIK